MSCVWKSPKSRFWIAQFTDHTGRRRNRSTKATDRRKAEKLAEHFEGAYARKRTARQIREVISAAYAEITGEQLINKSARSFSESWLAAKRHEVTESTQKFYTNAIGKFLTSSARSLMEIWPKSLVSTFWIFETTRRRASPRKR